MNGIFIRLFPKHYGNFIMYIVCYSKVKVSEINTVAVKVLLVEFVYVIRMFKSGWNVALDSINTIYHHTTVMRCNQIFPIYLFVSINQHRFKPARITILSMSGRL